MRTEQMIARAADGGPDIDPGVQADKLAEHLELKAQAATAAYTQIGNVLVSDPNKLEVVGTNAKCTPNVPGGCAPGMDQYAATGPEIADELMISHNTVRTHAYNAMTKLGARSRAHLVAKALGDGLVLD